MCKSNFYCYSELICHLCPGIYVLDYDIKFRCCMCVTDALPSSFRLMVHLRKKHNVCDVCLEMCHSQYKLSNHVWKHKLHHFCYRCGIAYRNKPDITRHLFWKHGTESVLCKKCLQKKWPHVYHFCVPPISFTCEECNCRFTKAVSLKVHKRLHTHEKKHICTFEKCSEAFVSKNLLNKHFKFHTEAPDDFKLDANISVKKPEYIEGSDENEEPTGSPKPVKAQVDLYNLPELNLSESDSSDSENKSDKFEGGEGRVQSTKESLHEKLQGIADKFTLNGDSAKSVSEQPTEQTIDEHISTSAMEDIWDNFKNYQANKEKMDNMLITDVAIDPYIPDTPMPKVEQGPAWLLALRDHDYCIYTEVPEGTDSQIEIKHSLESTESMDHDYCFQKIREKKNHLLSDISHLSKPLMLDEGSSKRITNSSSSSSDSDSSCACGSSCSCTDSSSGTSSSSNSNSDSSTQEGRNRQQQRRVKHKERNKVSTTLTHLHTDKTMNNDTGNVFSNKLILSMEIGESDLETTESDTDEEFYDREPQKLARKTFEEKRAQFLAEMGPDIISNGTFIESTSRPPTPPVGTLMDEEGTHIFSITDPPKRKKKNRKRKKRRNNKKLMAKKGTYMSEIIINEPSELPTVPESVPYYQQFHQMGNRSPIMDLTSTFEESDQTLPVCSPRIVTSSLNAESTSFDACVRASKRKRVPNKFYGYSTDDEGEKPQNLKKSKPDNKTNQVISPSISANVKCISPFAAASPRPLTVEPITLRLSKPCYSQSEYKSQMCSVPTTSPSPIFPSKVDSATESNDSDVDEPSTQVIAKNLKPIQPQLYCYCRCPYDEVSEMIGCDSVDCQIEWFHFECVGIMVPPKGQWFCPDCRKRKQQRSTI